MRLEADEQVEERRAAAYRTLDAFVAHRQDEPSVWVLAPVLRALFQVRVDGASGRSAEVHRSRILLEAAANSALSRVRPAGFHSRWNLVGGHLLCFSTHNQERVVRPLIDHARARGREVTLARQRPSSRLHRFLVQRSHRAADELLAALHAAGIRAPESTAFIHRQFIATARYLTFADAVLRAERPQSVVIATNHDKAARALVLVARQRGIPSVYIPHAPAIGAARLRDLPFDYAGLRGDAELAFYEGRTAEVDGIEVVGDPSLEVMGLVQLKLEDPLVFAPSYPEPRLEELVATLAATTTNVTVSPHPGQPKRIDAAYPERWHVWRGRTRDLLMRGPPVLVQQSSGVALEALLLGIPTIELSFEGKSPSYPFIDRRFVLFASSPGELSVALQHARHAAECSDRRLALFEWAQTWCERVGHEATERAWELIDQAALAGCRNQLIWEAWPRGDFSWPT